MIQSRVSMYLHCKHRLGRSTVQCIIQYPLLHDGLQIKSGTDTEITAGSQSIQSLRFLGGESNKKASEQK